MAMIPSTPTATPIAIPPTPFPMNSSTASGAENVPSTAATSATR